MSYQTSLLDIPSVISSPELESGHMPCDKPDGLTTDQFGQAPALANLSARQAKAAGLMTSGTYGQRSTISSASADLASYLESRLRARTDLLGSTLYKLTWKARATPSGRLIPALRASVRRTSDSDYIGWPTPKVASGDYQYAAGNHEKIVLNLSGTVQLTAWTTPSARDWKDSPGMNEMATNPDGTSRTRLDQLPRQAQLAGPARLTAFGEMLTGSFAETISGGRLDPAHSRWLMGLPPEWDACAVTAMPSSPRRLKRS